MKIEMAALREEMAECGYFNRSNHKIFKDKKKYDRKKDKNKWRQNEGE